LLNAAVGIASTWLIDEREPGELAGARWRGFVVAGLLALAFLQADRLTSLAESDIYSDEVVFARQSAYQRIVVTRSRASFQLFLNGNLQFSSGDEYRYHEALVHPAFAVAEHKKRVFIGGGGDGLAAREALRYPEVESIVLVDLDPAMTQLARTFEPLRRLNGDSLGNPKVQVVNEDAMVWLAERGGEFDVMLIDFPDPNNLTLGKLYTTRFYTLARRHLAPGGAMAVQATSPLFARASFWCIARTLEAAGFFVRPYHSFVPSFGEWGFVLARSEAFEVPARVDIGSLRWLNDATMRSLFLLGEDMTEVPVEINRLNNQALVQYYEREWRKWN
jgi:spermidine synthase